MVRRIVEEENEAQPELSWRAEGGEGRSDGNDGSGGEEERSERQSWISSVTRSGSIYNGKEPCPVTSPAAAPQDAWTSHGEREREVEWHCEDDDGASREGYWCRRP